MSHLDENIMRDRRSYSAVACLVIQTSGLVLATKYSYRQGAESYDSSSVIFVGEVFKLLTCVALECGRRLHSRKNSPPITASIFFMVIPATLYVIQNNLNFYALRGLTPAVFVVTAQLKIVTSAFFSAVLLNKKLNTRKVMAITLLLVGITTVHLEEGNSSSRAQAPPSQPKPLAFAALLAAVSISGLAGALLEKTFTTGNSSIWVKNAFLSAFSLPFAAFIAARDMFLKKPPTLFSGYDSVVCVVVTLHAIGGLLTAAVMRHAGVVAKCFAVSLSIVICVLIGIQLGVQEESRAVLFGSTLVISAVFMFFREK